MIVQILVGLIVILVLMAVLGKREKLVNSTRVVTLYYTNWCPHCSAMKPVYGAVAAELTGRGIVFKKNDEEKSPTPSISAYPTILMVDENGRTRKYRGGPDADRLRRWILSV